MNRKPGKKLPNPVNYSVWLLNYKPKSVKEMTLALKKRGFDDTTVDETVTSLLDWGYLNDESYRNYVIAKRKRNNPKGRGFVLRELQEAGISCGDEIETLYTDEEERELIAKLLAQWCRAGKPFTENKDRFYQRLYRRGFSSKNIMDQMCMFSSFPEKETD
jgi:SOS response regulatory protein OraA/RecX